MIHTFQYAKYYSDRGRPRASLRQPHVRYLAYTCRIDADAMDAA